MSNKQVKHFQKKGEVIYDAENINVTLLKQAKAQKEASENEFKRRARTSALQDAKYIQRDGTPDDVLKTADKLYQWLIKVLK